MGLGDDLNWIIWSDGRRVLTVNADVTEIPDQPQAGCDLVQISRRLKASTYDLVSAWMQQHGVHAYREYWYGERSQVRLSHLERFGFVEDLSLAIFEMDELPPLDKWFPGLVRLSIDETRTRALDVKVVTRLSHLKRLSLTGHPKFHHVASKLGHLEFLYLRGIPIRDAGLFDGWDALREFKLSGGKWSGPQVFEPLRELSSLEIGRIQGLADIDWLSQLENLEEFEIFWQPGVTRIGDLSAMRRLRKFVAQTMNGLQDVSGLATAPKLEEVMLGGCPKLELPSLRALVGHPTLRRVWAGNGTVRGNAEARAILGHLSEDR